MKQIVINVIPATKLSRLAAQVFSYALPAEIPLPVPGSVVEVPFGKKIVSAVVKNTEQAESLRELKPLTGVLQPEPVFTPQLFELAQNLSDHFLSPLGLMVKAMLPKIARRAKRRPQSRVRLGDYPDDLILTPDQKAAVASLAESLGKAKTFLLHGVTGSGKTEVYLRVLKTALEKKQQALILVPEISLTPQTLARFAARFPSEDIAVVHSKISYGQKYAIWEKIRAGEIKILIGPRSAVFAPFSSLGLIVIDEEHDSSYKQSDQNPKFDARYACESLSKIWSCPLIYGDATPSLETYHRAQEGQLSLLRLPVRINQNLPKAKIVDMREEAKRGNFSVISQELNADIASVLSAGKQAILFINRRGSATALICRDCGTPAQCERCSVPLVYHESKRLLVCHHCDKTSPILSLCPKCKSPRLKFFGTGTEKVEKEISALFPKARVLRFDRDAVKNKSGLETLYRRFAARDFDILVGTQLLAKGWDMDAIALTGVVNADTGLVFPDFRSNERTFQLITQVAGRAGRKNERGLAIFQTYLPENFAIRAATNHDYRGFYQREILDRQKFGYPPFKLLIKCTVKHGQQDKALKAGEELLTLLSNELLQDIEIIGPAPAFIPRLRGIYRVYVIIKQTVRSANDPLNPRLAEILNDLSPAWDIDVGPDNLL